MAVKYVCVLVSISLHPFPLAIAAKSLLRVYFHT